MRDAMSEGAVVVTGSNGFIGGRLARDLSAGRFDLVLVDHKHDSSPDEAMLLRPEQFPAAIPANMPIRHVVHLGATTDTTPLWKAR